MVLLVGALWPAGGLACVLGVRSGRIPGYSLANAGLSYRSMSGTT